MKKFSVSEPEKMSAILNIFSKLDDIRWNGPGNYNLINYCRDDLTDDEKLLTHWLCYIVDRQMPFERIWDIGGYVLSNLVHGYTSNPDRDVRQLLKDYYEVDPKNGNLTFKSRLESPNQRLSRYGISSGPVRFASRYIPEDLILIYRTLVILDKRANRSLATYMSHAFAEHLDFELEVQRLAQILNQLTYAGGGRLSASEADQRLDKVDRDISCFEVDLEANEKLSGRKRLWCSLRDYLKSPEFNPHFVAALRRSGYQHADRWKRSSPDLKKALKVLELPGDVWNNFEIFRKGLFTPNINNPRKSWDMPKTVREIYQQLSNIERDSFYPEQLDVTFDFVPRMCEESMCKVCFFGGGIRNTCHQNKDLLCPVALYSCGYVHQCNPEDCALKEDSVKGLCVEARNL